MPLVIREMHAAPTSGALNEEWILIENTGPGPISTAGLTLAISAKGKGRPRALGPLPNSLIKSGEKVRLIVGSPGRPSQGTPPPEAEGVRNLPLFLKEAVVQPGRMVHLRLNQHDLCTAAVVKEAAADVGASA